MRRRTRPSDLYRLPDAGNGAAGAGADEQPASAPVRGAPKSHATPDGPRRPGSRPGAAVPGEEPQSGASQPRRSRVRTLVIGGAVVALVLVLGGLGLSTTPEPGAVGPAPVDLAAEDTALSWIRLYAAERDGLASVAAHRLILAAPGPEAAAADLQERAAGVRSAAAAAVAGAPGGPGSVTDYVRAPGHAALATALDDLAARADDIALLAAAHDSILAGAGAVSLPAAQQELTSRFGTGIAPSHLQRWAAALLALMEDEGSPELAQQARAEALDRWAGESDGLLARGPAATDQLRAQLGMLPPATRKALQGHPLAGPALRDLGG